ncbi:hypothetical protein [Streptomyces anulatus]|uniref:hypothetical protein n=1 Tax=Streptomyces anulatus TaxID=1892 RepID=UPI001C252CDF|nr:hypothetical protein [Streptomyces anulatus]
MAATGVSPVTAWVRAGTRQRLSDALELQKTRKVMLSAADRWQTYDRSRNDAARVRAAWKTEVMRMRQHGELLDVVDALCAFGIAGELEARGWAQRRFRRAPAEARLPGRWPGSRDGGYQESVQMRLPSELAARVLDTCWGTSAPHIARLRDWRDRNPGIVIPRGPLGRTDELTGPMAEYERLASQVTTVGDIYRAGIHRGIEAAEERASHYRVLLDTHRDAGGHVSGIAG